MSKKYGYIASIGVDTSGVVNALKDVEENTKNISTRIRAINEGLKFDSKSPELLSQKYEAISEQMDNVTKKLEALKSVEQQAEAARQRGDMSKEKYAAYSRAISETESKLKLYNVQLANTKVQLEQAQAAFDKTAFATKGLGGTLENLDANEKELNATLKEMNAALSSGAGADVLTDKHHILAQAIENTRQRLEALKSAEKNMAEGVSNGNVSVEEQKKYQNEIQRTELKLKQYEGQLEQTRKKLYDNATATDKADEETKQFDDTLQQAGKSALSFGDVFKANVFSDFVVNGIRRAKDAIIDFAKSSIETASNLAEVQNVVDVTFGDNAQSINTWSREAATAFGMSELAAKQYAGTMGAMLKSSGIAEDSVTDLSKSIVQLAGDMASFYNLDISASFDKIRAGIAGETEPLRQLGINMSVANLEAYALSQGIETAWKNMSQSEQVMLRYNYLMAQTADAQGDFARTSDSLANQQRIAKLNMEQMQAALGEKLIPLVGELTGELNENMPSIGDTVAAVGDKVVDLTKFVLDNKAAVLSAVSSYVAFKGAMTIGNTISSAVNAYRTLTTVTNAATVAQEANNVAVAANPYMLLISAVAAAAVAIGTYIAQIDNAIESEKEIKKAADETVVSSEAEARTVEAKAERYKRLYEEYKKTGVATSEMKELAKDLQELAPDTIKLIDEEKGAYNELSESIQDVITQIRLKGIEQAKSNSLDSYYNNITEYYTQQAKAYQDYSKKVANISDDTLAELEKGAKGAYKDFFTNTTGEYGEFGINRDAAMAAAGLDPEAFQTYIDANDRLNFVLNSTNEKISETEQLIQDTSDSYDKLAQNMIAANDAEEKIVNTGMGGTQAMADHYRQEGTSVAKELEDYEKELEAGLKSIEEQYNKHQIVNGNGEQDEAEYYKRRREYLQEHCDKTSEIWWKHWDDVANKEKQMRDKQQNESEKAAKDAQTKKDDALKDGLDAIQTEYESTSIPEEQALKAEGDYLLKRRQYLQEHCDEASDVWKKYWADQLKDEKKYRDKLSDADKDNAKKDAEEWSKAFDEMVDRQKKAHDELTKQKEKAYEDLSGIDLISTVTGADGKDKTILTDLNAATKKLTEYQNSLARLKNTGISDDLLNEILAMDYESGARQSMINTLLGLSADKRKLYYDDYEKYNAKAKEVAQKQVQDEVDELNQTTSEAVTGAFQSVTNSAYIAGADTAKSFLKGISENMSGLLTAMSGTTDLDTIRALLNIDSNMFAGAAKGPASTGGGFYNTPITINLNDKEYINTTLGDLMEQGRLTGGNTFNL